MSNLPEKLGILGEFGFPGEHSELGFESFSILGELQSGFVFIRFNSWEKRILGVLLKIQSFP